ncbi:hypothetical protein [Streptomyces sp. NPDC005407]|uniref:hypothetical protein n=1 Tax=Streptomyces sp. NPDC005407 TaxID=3155340 RepID=UPI0033A6473B
MDKYDLHYYPTGAGFEGRQLINVFDTFDQAADHAGFPNPADWKVTTEGSWATDSQAITEAGGTYQPYTIDHRILEAEPSGDVEVRIVRGGEQAVMVDPAAYADAKNAGPGQLRAFLAQAITSTPATLTAVEWTGELVDLPTNP